MQHFPRPGFSKLKMQRTWSWWSISEIKLQRTIGVIEYYITADVKPEMNDDNTEIVNESSDSNDMEIAKPKNRNHIRKKRKNDLL